MKIVRVLVILTIIACLTYITIRVENKKDAEASILSGVFENQPTTVSSRTSGRVQDLFVDEGSVVKKGDKLLKLDPGPLLTELEASKARISEAKANLDNLKAGTRPEDIDKQVAVIAELEANLAMLENGNRPQEIAQAQSLADKAQANLNKLRQGPRKESIAQAKANLETNKAQMEFAKAEHSRYSNLYSNGAVSRQEYEKRLELYKTAAFQVENSQQMLLELERGYRPEDIQAASFELDNALERLSLMKAGARSEEISIAKARLAQAKAQLARLKVGSRPEEIAQAKAQMHTAELNAKALDEKIKEYIVLSPIDGVIDAKLVAQGDLVPEGKSLFTVSNPKDIWIKVYMAQSKLALIKVGSEAQLKIDGIEQLKKAKVETIATKGEFTPANLQTPEERGQQVFAVKLRLTEFDPAVKAGMSATVKTVGSWKDRT